jgi:hypothetical protein
MLMRTHRSALEELDALSRTRPLSDLETLRLERAVRRSCGRREQWHWTRADDLRLFRHLLRGRKPKTIALLMKRSEQSVWTRMRRLGLNARKISDVISGPGSGRKPVEKSPIALSGGKEG